MEILETTRGSSLIISLNGRLDHAGAQVLEEFAKGRIIEGQHKLIIDFTKSDFIASMGMRALMTIYKQIAPAGGSVIVTGLTPQMHGLFEKAGLLEVFKACDSVEDAVTATE